MLFVNCVVVNPAFDSQTKDYLNTPISKFGSRCEVSDKTDKLAKMVLWMPLKFSEVKQKKVRRNPWNKVEIKRCSKINGCKFWGGPKSHTH